MNIRLIEVQHISTNVSFRSNVSSSLVGTVYNYSMAFRYFAKDQYLEDLITAVESSRPVHSGKVADLRWGFLFSSNENERLLAIYFDKSGRAGVLNGACVNFESDALLKWAEANCGCILR